MDMKSKIFIVSALMCVSAAAAYSQDCNTYLRRATELVSQQKYCEAKSYYQMYGKCNADADVSTEIAMCERRCKIEAMEGGGDEPVVTPRRDNPPSRGTTAGSGTSSGDRPVKPPKTQKSRTGGFSGFQLHGGVFLPMGDFGEIGKNILYEWIGTPGTGIGNAGLGFHLGFKVYNPIPSVEGLSWLFGADGYYNGLKSDYKDYMIDIAKDNELGYKLPFYLNVPVTTGINYAYPINHTFSIYGEVAGGLNLSMFTKMKLFDDEYSDEVKMKMGSGFTFNFGAGVLLNEKLTIGIRYNNLGAYKYKGKEVEKYLGEVIEENEVEFLKKLPISGISLTVGILF